MGRKRSKTGKIICTGKTHRVRRGRKIVCARKGHSKRRKSRR